MPLPPDLIIETGTLSPVEFIELSKAVGWGVARVYDMEKVAQALTQTSLTVVVRNSHKEPIGCGRAFSDDLLQTFIADLFVRPEWQKKGIGRLLVETMKERYGHTAFFFGAQPDNEAFFESLGFSKSIQSYSGKFRENPYFV